MRSLPLSTLVDALGANVQLRAGSQAALPQVRAVVRDTDDVVPGALFCCVPGQRVDGHDLAPLAVERMVDRVAALKAEGLSIVLAEQNTDMVLALCERMHVMEKGVIRATLTPEEVRADETRLTRFLML